MKSKLKPLLIAGGLILLIIAGFLAVLIVKEYLPSRESADKQELLQVEGEETAIFFNSQLQEAQGITREGQIYLPVTWVNENLNERFYWDDVEKLMVYTMPDSIVYADRRTMGSSGLPLLLIEEEEVYLSLGIICSYTDIQTRIYSEDGLNRVFVDNIWTDKTIALAKKDSSVRVWGDIKSPVITEVPKDSRMFLLETSEEWARVETADGYIGYTKVSHIKDIHAEPQISSFQPPVYTNIALEEKVCLAWHQVASGEANNAMESLVANTSGLNVIAPTWFALTDNYGNYHSYADSAYVEKAHALGLQVWGVLDNFNMGQNVNSAVLFAQTSVRKTLISNLMTEVLNLGIDGINLDIEGISPAAGPHYVQFIRELSIECRKHGIILSVDNYVPSDYTSFYNRAEQGRVADYVIIMGYDEHYAGGEEAGSVASLPYVTQGIEDTLREVPKEKVINAIPFYTRIWTNQEGKITSSALSIDAAKNWVIENQVELYWQDAIGQYYGELQTGEGMKMIWMEEETSLGLKMEAIKTNDLAGVACWKLGLEPTDIWEIVKVNE